jgi:hypothetical protein
VQAGKPVLFGFRGYVNSLLEARFRLEKQDCHVLEVGIRAPVNGNHFTQSSSDGRKPKEIPGVAINSQVLCHLWVWW